MSIANFMSWFLQQFVRIGTFMIGKLDEIKIIGQVSLLDFTITLVIITAFIGLIITAPRLETASARLESRRKFLDSEEKRYEKWWDERR